ncbi:hypothetical protein [Xinfangfangia pollutisoli]|uniref:hypothetical protein n=1 Tax=Xinfangfangia pollutisoli TaxID=2865960 RepID=UPI001CD69FF5|nr:hypothetical protein [Xinfangfangia pollutisoli]
MPEAITFQNTLLPLGLLMALVLLLPWALMSGSLSQARLAGAIAFTALAALAAGALWLAFEGWRLQGSVPEASRVGEFLARSVWFAMFWGPLLALVWLVRAQGIERRKGLAMGRGDGR